MEGEYHFDLLGGIGSTSIYQRTSEPYFDIYILRDIYLVKLHGLKSAWFVVQKEQISYISKTGGDRCMKFLENMNLNVGQVNTPIIIYGPTHWRVYDQICYKKPG